MSNWLFEAGTKDEIGFKEEEESFKGRTDDDEDIKRSDEDKLPTLEDRIELDEEDQEQDTNIRNRDDLMEAGRFSSIKCAACGNEYCDGHEVDSVDHMILVAHASEDHSNCHPNGCNSVGRGFHAHVCTNCGGDTPCMGTRTASVCDTFDGFCKTCFVNLAGIKKILASRIAETSHKIASVVVENCPECGNDDGGNWDTNMDNTISCCECGAVFEEGDYMGDNLDAAWNLGPRIPGKTDPRYVKSSLDKKKLNEHMRMRNVGHPPVTQEEVDIAMGVGHSLEKAREEVGPHRPVESAKELPIWIEAAKFRIETDAKVYDLDNYRQEPKSKMQKAMDWGNGLLEKGEKLLFPEERYLDKETEETEETEGESRVPMKPISVPKIIERPYRAVERYLGLDQFESSVENVAHVRADGAEHTHFTELDKSIREEHPETEALERSMADLDETQDTISTIVQRIENRGQNIQEASDKIDELKTEMPTLEEILGGPRKAETKSEDK